MKPQIKTKRVSGVNVESKLLTLENAEIKAATEQYPNGTIEGYASTHDLDSYGDIVMPGAFAAAIPEFLKSGFVAWGHEWSDQPIAMPREAYEDDHGLYVVAEFHSTDEAQEARVICQERLSRGLMVGFSIGYSVEDYEITADARLLKVIGRLFEFSIVNVPANAAAGATAVKGSDDGSLPAGEQLADNFDRVLDEVKGLIGRAQAINEIRTKDGRVLSEANRNRLSALATSMSEALKDLQDLLDATAPEAPKGRTKEQAARLRLMAEATIAAFSD